MLTFECIFLDHCEEVLNLFLFSLQKPLALFVMLVWHPFFCALSFLRNQCWSPAKLSVHSSTLTVLRCLSASVQPPGAGVVGFKRSSVPSSNPDPLLLTASVLNLLLSVRLLPQQHQEMIIYLFTPQRTHSYSRWRPDFSGLGGQRGQPHLPRVLYSPHGDDAPRPDGEQPAVVCAPRHQPGEPPGLQVSAAICAYHRKLSICVLK